jgi:hypothetical protein
MVSYPLSAPRLPRAYYHTVAYKDINAVMPYSINWDTLLPHGDTIATATSTAYVHGSTTATTTDITVDSTATTDRTTTTVLSAGLDMGDYDITVHVVTDAGYEDDRTMMIRCTHL